jgi:hypothetical protein
MSQNTLLLIFAIINLVVLAVFAGTILRQYLRRRREAQLYWSLALLMAFFATLAYILLVVGTPTSSAGLFFFRLYYSLGAALTPAWLGLGSIALVTGKRVSRTCLFVLVGLSLAAVVTISDAPINLVTLAHIAGTPGTGILGNGAWLPLIIIMNTAGVALVGGVALYSGWKFLRRQASVAGSQPGNLLWGNLLILLGALLDGAAGTLSRLFGLSSSFWLVMAVGWFIFYLGVLLIGRRKRKNNPSEQSAETKNTVASF